MSTLSKKLTRRANLVKNYLIGLLLLNDPIYKGGIEKGKLEDSKLPKRTQVINFLLSQLNRETYYLEIGVRNPEDNYNHIKAHTKYSVDPGIEFIENPVDFKVTSDNFFHRLDNNEILHKDIRFDVIFIDGLHLAEQVDKDISNSLRYIKDDGFIVLHDCNPPTEWHSRETGSYFYTPAKSNWNGTTWKAFLQWRFNNSVHSCCVDCDWGVGILSKKHAIGQSINATNPFYEFNVFDKNRDEHLNLIEFTEFENMIKEQLSTTTDKHH